MCVANRVLRGLATVFACVFTPLFSGCLNASGTFFDAINQENVATVKRLLKANPSLSKVENPSGETGLNKAVEHYNAEIVKLLIDAGADVNHDCSRLGLPLHAAAYYGHVEIAQLLLEAGADPSIQAPVPSQGANKTALHKAASGGHPGCVELLLGHGVDVNATTSNCAAVTPLWLAIGVGRRDPTRVDVIRILLENGADPNASHSDGTSPLKRLRDIRATVEGSGTNIYEFDFAKAEELLLQYGAKK